MAGTAVKKNARKTADNKDKVFFSRFLGDVDDANVRGPQDDLDRARSQSAKFIVQLPINTQGGNINYAFALYDYLRRYPAPIFTIAEGLVASAGTIVYLAGDHRLITPHAAIMIHPPKRHITDENLDRRQLRALDERLKHLEEMYVEIVLERTGLSRRAVSRFLSQDKFFYAEEAVKCGLANDIL